MSENERILNKGKKQTKASIDVEQVGTLCRWSLLLAVFHGLSATALIVASQQLSVTEVPLVFNTVDNRITPAVIHLGNINLLYFTFAFELLAALRLFYTSTIGAEKYAYHMQTNGMNPYRWVEYSVSASIMTVAIAMLSGVLDVVLLYVLFATTAITMLCGYISDFAVPSNQTTFAIGTSTFVVTWGVIYVHFLYHAASVPWFVYAINIGILLAEMSFALVQYKKIKQTFTVLQAERWFLVLELFSKFYLAWIVFGGIISLP